MCELLYSQGMESFIHDTLLMCELLYSQGMESFIRIWYTDVLGKTAFNEIKIWRKKSLFF